VTCGKGWTHLRGVAPRVADGLPSLVVVAGRDDACSAKCTRLSRCQPLNRAAASANTGKVQYRQQLDGWSEVKTDASGEGGQRISPMYRNTFCRFAACSLPTKQAPRRLLGSAHARGPGSRLKDVIACARHAGRRHCSADAVAGCHGRQGGRRVQCSSRHCNDAKVPLPLRNMSGCKVRASHTHLSGWRWVG